MFKRIAKTFMMVTLVSLVSGCGRTTTVAPSTSAMVTVVPTVVKR